jgi:serine/threonine protein kinase
VLVSGTGAVRLADFGNTELKMYTLKFTSTKCLGSYSLRWAVRMLYRYLPKFYDVSTAGQAPELLEQKIVVLSKEADVYALGMVSDLATQTRPTVLL